MNSSISLLQPPRRHIASQHSGRSARCWFFLPEKRCPWVLNPEQLLFLLSLGREKGCHAAISFISERCNYREPEPVEPMDETAELQKEYIQSVEAQEKMIVRMERMARLREAS